MSFFNNISFKFKTILGIAFIESILLALIYFTSINSLNETNEKQIVSRANETSNLIALWVRNGLLTYDVGNTEAFIENLSQGESLLYIHVKNDEGKTFAFAGDEEFKYQLTVEDSSLDSAYVDGVFDVVSKIEIDGIQIGTVELGLSVSELSKFIDQVAYKIKAIAIAEVFLSALFSWFLGWLLTRRLDNLKDVAGAVKEGRSVDLFLDDAKDEIGMVSQAFKSMTSSLIDNESKLKSTSLKLEKVFNETPDGIVVIFNDGTIGSVNPAFHKIVNCSKNLDGKSLQYETFISLLESHVDSSDYLSHKWLESIGSLHGLLKAESPQKIQFSKPNFRLLEFTLQSIGDQQTGIHSILYFKDLTKTQELERLKSAFLAHAAHELRTPLTSVQGFSEILMMPGDVDEGERIELAGIINSQSKRVVEMVTQLLDISAIESGGLKNMNFAFVDLVSLVNKVVEDYKLDSDRELPKLRISPATPKVYIDYDRMYQVVLNLLSNAYKYSNSEDNVEIKVAHFVNSDNKTCVDLVVSDTGLGMSNGQVSKIFDRFWRADNSGNIPGTGLGMSLVKEIVDAFGGDIFVSSRLGEGTSITVRLCR